MFNKRLKIVKFKDFIPTLLALYLLSMMLIAHAKTQPALSDVIQDIIVNNPEIQASWHQYQQLSNQQSGAQSVSLLQMLYQGFSNPSPNETSQHGTQLLAMHMHATQITQQFLLVYLDYLAAKNQLSLQKHTQYNINLLNEIVLGNDNQIIDAEINKQSLAKSETMLKLTLVNLQTMVDNKILLGIESTEKLDFLTKLSVPPDIKLALNSAQNNMLNFSALNLESPDLHGISKEIAACKTIQQTMEQSYQNIQNNLNSISRVSQSITADADMALTHKLIMNKENLVQLIKNEKTQLFKRQEIASFQYQIGLSVLRVHSSMGDLLSSLDLTPLVAEYLSPSSQKIDSTQCVFTDPVPALKQSKNSTDQQLMLKINGWIQAWQAQNTHGFLSFYSRNFKPEKNITLEEWRIQRGKALFYNHHIEVNITELLVTNIDENNANISFKQDFKSDEFSDVIIKKQDWQKINDVWFIVSESNQ